MKLACIKTRQELSINGHDESSEERYGKNRSLLFKVSIDQKFGDLDGIERRAFSKVIADHPEIDPVFYRRVLPNPADKSGIFTHALHRRYKIFSVLNIVDNNPWGFFQDLSGVVCGQWVFKFHVNRLAVANKHRNPDASGRQFDLGSRILAISRAILFSSAEFPPLSKSPIFGIRLKAICLGNTLGAVTSLTKIERVW